MHCDWKQIIIIIAYKYTHTLQLLFILDFTWLDNRPNFHIVHANLWFVCQQSLSETCNYH